MSPLCPPPTTTTSQCRAASSATGIGSPTRPSVCCAVTDAIAPAVTRPVRRAAFTSVVMGAR